ncbi:DUF6503 family protein [Portibacter marinus]|uniref:DUF6503 family protein n=1 Tax=Portibacter marinus TaxID=2898660 RepID=UPI001F280D1D|nr:DUF6503 family protein [Portibacter marinus]
MKQIILFLFLTHFAYSQSEAVQLIDRSIQHHDPKDRWHQLQAAIDIHSMVRRKDRITTTDRFLTLDIKENKFTMRQDSTVYSFPCENCDRAKMYNDYFRYLIGMPMKLKDTGTIIHHDIEVKYFKNKAYQVITVTYDPTVGTDTWKFYFDPENAELDVIEFSKDGTFENGETIELNDKIKFQNMLLPGQLKWFVLPDRKFLAEENITYKKL